MMGVTHIWVGTMAAVLLMEPKSPEECLAALIGGAMGSIACDIDLSAKTHQSDTSRSRQLVGGIVLACIMADSFFLHKANAQNLYRGFQDACCGPSELAAAVSVGMESAAPWRLPFAASTCAVYRKRGYDFQYVSQTVYGGYGVASGAGSAQLQSHPAALSSWRSVVPGIVPSRWMARPTSEAHWSDWYDPGSRNCHRTFSLRVRSFVRSCTSAENGPLQIGTGH